MDHFKIMYLRGIEFFIFMFIYGFSIILMRAPNQLNGIEQMLWITNGVCIAGMVLIIDRMYKYFWID